MAATKMRKMVPFASVMSSRQFSTSFSIDDLQEVKEASACVKRGDWRGAHQLLRQAQAIFASAVPLELRIRAKQAHVAFLEGDLETETKIRRDVLQRIPQTDLGNSQNYLLAWSSLALALTRAGEIEEAVKLTEAVPKPIMEDEEANARAKLVSTVVLSHVKEVPDEKIRSFLDVALSSTKASLATEGLLAKIRYNNVGLGATELDEDLNASIESLASEDEVNIVIPYILGCSSMSSDKNFNIALKRFEDLGDSNDVSLAISNILRLIAWYKMYQGDGVVAEGLYRSILSRLDAYLPDTVFRQHLLIQSFTDYGSLLEGMEWNGRSRKTEGQTYIDKAQDLKSSTRYFKNLDYSSPADAYFLDRYGSFEFIN